MRLRLIVDSYGHDIDSTDPELLGKWIIEIFGRITWSPATYVQVQVGPSYIPGVKPGFDWIADSRYMVQQATVKSPRDVIAAMSAALDEYESKGESDG